MNTLTLFYIITIIAIILLGYTVFKYFNHPRRKLLKAQKNEQFYLLNQLNDVNKNLEFTYKGCLFTGEKHLGLAENKFRVVAIYITAHEPLELIGLTEGDLSFLKEKVHLQYQGAHIEWKYPINQLLLQTKSKQDVQES